MTDNALAVATEMVPALRGLRAAELFTDTGLREENLDGYTEQELLKLAAGLGTIHNWTRWAIADLILYGERSFGEMYAAFAEATGRSADTLRRWVWVAERVPKSRRNADLSFSLHQEVAVLKPVEQRRLLKVAAAETETNAVFTVREFKQVIRDDFEARGEEPPTKRSTKNKPVAVEDAAAGLPTVYVVPGPVVRRLVRDAIPGRDGYSKVPRDLIERLAAVVEQTT